MFSPWWHAHPCLNSSSSWEASLLRLFGLPHVRGLWFRCVNSLVPILGTMPFSFQTVWCYYVSFFSCVAASDSPEVEFCYWLPTFFCRWYHGHLPKSVANNCSKWDDKLQIYSATVTGNVIGQERAHTNVRLMYYFADGLCIHELIRLLLFWGALAHRSCWGCNIGG